MSDPRIETLKAHIRDVPDFPKPGILFKDITPLLADGPALKLTVNLLAERIEKLRADVVVAVESRGFLFGAAVATTLGIGLAPVRKPGKLPWQKRRVEYALEYGTDALEMHSDALREGIRVVIVDDLLATGGTAAATARLCEQQGANVLGCHFVIELEFLKGRDRLAPVPSEALIVY